MTGAEKEQIKLRANYLNGIAIAVLGMITPILAVYRTLFITRASLTIDAIAGSIVSVAAAFFISRMLHDLALSRFGKFQPRPIKKKAKNLTLHRA